MTRPERLVKLLEILRTHAGAEAGTLARACGISGRTLSRDLDALTAAGFPVYFDHGYRLAAPTFVPPITLTLDEALALRLAAQAAAPRVEPVTTRALALATEKLHQALATRALEVSQERQLTLTLPIQDARAEALMATLSEAIAERRSVRLRYVAASRQGAQLRRVDPYRLLPSPTGWVLLAYSHDRCRILRIPVARLREAFIMGRRFHPVPPRLLERHLHRGPAAPSGPHRVRLALRPPLVQTLRQHLPTGVLMVEDGPEGSAIFTLAALRTKDLIPWLLACGDAVEVLEPDGLRQEIHRIAHAMAARHRTGPLAMPSPNVPKGPRDQPVPESPS